MNIFEVYTIGDAGFLGVLLNYSSMILWILRGALSLLSVVFLIKAIRTSNFTGIVKSAIVLVVLTGIVLAGFFLNEKATIMVHDQLPNSQKTRQAPQIIKNVPFEIGIVVQAVSSINKKVMVSFNSLDDSDILLKALSKHIDENKYEKRGASIYGLYAASQIPQKARSLLEYFCFFIIILTLVAVVLPSSLEILENYFYVFVYLQIWLLIYCIMCVAIQSLFRSNNAISNYDITFVYSYFLLCIPIISLVLTKFFFKGLEKATTQRYIAALKERERQKQTINQ